METLRRLRKLGCYKFLPYFQFKLIPMKAKSIMLLAFLLGLLTSGSSFANTPEIYISKNFVVAAKPSSVRVHRQADGVMVTWSSSSQPGVVAYEVERTYFDAMDEYASWDKISYTASANSRSFKAYDAGVYPGYISYRVVAISADGSRSASEVVTIRIVSREKF